MKFIFRCDEFHDKIVTKLYAKRSSLANIVMLFNLYKSSPQKDFLLSRDKPNFKAAWNEHPNPAPSPINFFKRKAKLKGNHA